ncbi:hypothetical protein VP01_5282g2 [Puccinia sorghi]|uniref:Uncharacterized protein n=1 Tax=Puccinia sorghi TaxID=27349 RepID=A0A0L6UL41_9BASI|nr:hypothetical protein VP01_5282g2 [Puccinia sorghi]
MSTHNLAFVSTPAIYTLNLDHNSQPMAPKQPEVQRRDPPCVLPAAEGEISDIDLNDLVKKHGHYVWLVAEDKDEIDKAYDEYQRKIHIITCKKRLHIDSVLGYLGKSSRALWSLYRQGINCGSQQ